MRLVAAATTPEGRRDRQGAVARAEEEFERVYAHKHGVPDDVREVSVATEGAGLWFAKALSSAGLVKSTSDGKRVIAQGGVEVDGARVSDETYALPTGGRYLLRPGPKTRLFA